MTYDDPYRLSGRYLDFMIAGWWEHHGPAEAGLYKILRKD